MGSALFYIIITACGLQFVSAALLSVVPVLIPEKAGIAFSVYSAAKILFLFFAGKITTRLSASRAFPLAILIEAIALTLSGFFPDLLLYFRSLEGIALALGMVSSFTLLREMHESEASLEKSVAKIMIGSGLCLVVGPFFGGSVADLFPALFLRVSGLLYFLLFFAILYFRPFVTGKGKSETLHAESFVKPKTSSSSSPVSWRLILALAATHAIGIGLQPLIAYWGKTLFPIFQLGGGFTFLAIGIGFFAGVLGRGNTLLKISHPLGILGFLGLEFAVQLNDSFAGGSGSSSLPLWPIWLVSVALIGFWYAYRSKRLTAELGFSGEAHLGEDQALWLFWTGIPSAIVPMVSWRLRDPHEFSLARIGLETLLLGLSVGLTLIVARPRSQQALTATQEEKVTTT
jgi:MFS family permease